MNLGGELASQHLSAPTLEKPNDFPTVPIDSPHFANTYIRSPTIFLTLPTFSHENQSFATSSIDRPGKSTETQHFSSKANIFQHYVGIKRENWPGPFFVIILFDCVVEIWSSCMGALYWARKYHIQGVCIKV